MYKIMIVEDDPMVAMINEQFVNRCGDFSVTHRCSNGEDALAILVSAPVDLVIMDVYMPRLDGIETLKKIREKDIPVSVIMVTAANDNSTVEEAVRLGAIDYLVKPFTFDRFKQALEKFRNSKQVLDSDRALDQRNIDILLGNSPVVRQEQEPKGSQDRTRERLMDCLAVSGEASRGLLLSMWEEVRPAYCRTTERGAPDSVCVWQIRGNGRARVRACRRGAIAWRLRSYRGRARSALCYGCGRAADSWCPR